MIVFIRIQCDGIEVDGKTYGLTASSKGGNGRLMIRNFSVYESCDEFLDIMVYL